MGEEKKGFFKRLVDVYKRQVMVCDEWIRGVRGELPVQKISNNGKEKVLVFTQRAVDRALVKELNAQVQRDGERREYYLSVSYTHLEQPGCGTSERIDLPRSGCRKYWIQACTETGKSRSLRSDDSGNRSSGQRSVQRMLCK